MATPDVVVVTSTRILKYGSTSVVSDTMADFKDWKAEAADESQENFDCLRMSVIGEAMCMYWWKKCR